MKRKLKQSVLIIRTDNGKEYVNCEFKKFLSENGIHHQLTVPYTPQQNGVAERANRTVVEMARCMMIGSGLPDYLWAEAVNTAVHIRNISITRSVENKTPQEAWSGKIPTVKYLKIFGSKAVMLKKGPKQFKFSPKGTECFMVGYSNESKAYRVYVPSIRNVVKTRDVKFFENTKCNLNLIILEKLETEADDDVFQDNEIKTPETKITSKEKKMRCAVSQKLFANLEDHDYLGLE
jgi:transposase InsO family protein